MIERASGTYCLVLVKLPQYGAQVSTWTRSYNFDTFIQGEADGLCETLAVCRAQVTNSGQAQPMTDTQHQPKSMCPVQAKRLECLQTWTGADEENAQPMHPYTYTTARSAGTLKMFAAAAAAAACDSFVIVDSTSACARL